jgi:hypothetical protein
MDTRNVVARFEAERQALAMMDHPNIAKVFYGRVESRAGVPPALAASAAEEHATTTNDDAPSAPGRRDACPAFSRPHFVTELVRGLDKTVFTGFAPFLGTPACLSPEPAGERRTVVGFSMAAKEAGRNARAGQDFGRSERVMQEPAFWRVYVE